MEDDLKKKWKMISKKKGRQPSKKMEYDLKKKWKTNSKKTWKTPTKK
jgi:hypothetical protein